MGSGQILLRTGSDHHLYFFCIFEKNYKDWIKCKLSKSRTKWTGLREERDVCHYLLRFSESLGRSTMQLFLEYVDTKEVQIVYNPQILQGKPMEKPCKHLQCRGKFVISGQRMAKPTQLCHKNTFIFRFEKPNLFQNAITLIRNETITSICYFC